MTSRAELVEAAARALAGDADHTGDAWMDWDVHVRFGGPYGWDKAMLPEWLTLVSDESGSTGTEQR